MIIEIKICDDTLHRFEVLRVRGEKHEECLYEVTRVYTAAGRELRDLPFFIKHYYDDGAVELTRKVMVKYMEMFGKGIHN